MSRHTKLLNAADTEVAVQKKNLRSEKCRLRRQLSDQMRHEKSEAIFQHLAGSAAYRQADVLLIYASYQEEVETYLMIKQALLDQKRVFCPKVMGKQLFFYEIREVDELIPGFRGIPEPEGTSACFLPGETEKHGIETDPAPYVLILLPGTVFDRNGGRIGYGGGFYDRFLAEWKDPDRPCCIGLSYDCQLTEEVPAEHFDICMDALITEQGMEFFTARGKSENSAL